MSKKRKVKTHAAYSYIEVDSNRDMVVTLHLPGRKKHNVKVEQKGDMIYFTGYCEDKSELDEASLELHFDISKINIDSNDPQPMESFCYYMNRMKDGFYVPTVIGMDIFVDNVNGNYSDLFLRFQPTLRQGVILNAIIPYSKIITR
jgi:hypothetical protein